MIHTIQRMSQALGRRLSPLHRRLLRILLLAVTGVLAVLVAVQLAAPLLISTPIVRNGMEQALAEWTGDQVTIDGAPTIRFLPVPRIEVSRVAITKPTSDGIRVLARISRLSANFSLYQALQGRIAFRNFELVEPEFFVLRDATGRLDWADEGLLSAAASNAAIAEGNLTLDPKLDPRVGDVTIENGRVEIDDSATGQIWRAAGMTGRVQWPRLSQPASFQLSAQVGGRSLQLSGSSPQPLMLLSGRNAPFEGRFSSDIMSARFNGTANLANYAAVSGDVEIAIADAPTALAWTGVTLPGLEQLKQFSLSARLLTTAETLRFDALDLSFNETEADGVLDLAMPAGRPPRLTGTLAFERLNLPALYSAITPSGDTHSELTKGLDLDLRISGQEMSFGPLLLTQTALGIMNEGGQSRIDIVDGTLEGGRLTSQMVTSNSGPDVQGNVRIALHDANLQSVLQKLEISGPLPQTRGSIELSFKPGRQGFSVDWRDAEGLIRITTGAGTLPDLDPAAILQRVGELNYQPLQNPDGQDFGYQKLDVTAAFKDGTAEIQSGVIESTSTKVVLAGLVPFVDGGLALSARIASVTEPGSDRVLFIGGSTSKPVAIAVRGAAIPAGPQD